MEVVWTLLCCVVTGVVVGIFLRREHAKEMQELASDCSQKVQSVHRDLVIVCTEPESPEANEIILRHRLNQSAKQLIKQNKEEYV